MTKRGKFAYNESTENEFAEVVKDSDILVVIGKEKDIQDLK
jgi:hypothetical protein